MDAGSGDQHAAFRRLFEDAYRPLLAYSLRRTESAADAEEIVAETLLIAWRRRGQQRRGRLERMLAPLMRSSQDPELTVQLADATRAVVTASRRLPDADREVLRLAAWEGLSHAQIAISLGCSENAAALRLHRARQRLREELAKEGRFPGQEVVEVIR